VRNEIRTYERERVNSWDDLHAYGEGADSVPRSAASGVAALPYSTLLHV
jgi:hypothetical protein